MNRQRGEAAYYVLGTLAVALIGIGAFWGLPVYSVWQQEKSGEAALAKAQQERQILVAQAQAEKESAQLRADAIAIMGQKAKEYPEYREQEFIGAFSEALKDGKVSQIIYVPTEANIPIIEARHRP